MIIIDQGTQDKLIQALKSLTNMEGKYCIRIHPVEGNISQVRQKIIAQVQQYLPGTNIYFCEDGEIYLLTESASLKECKKTMLGISSTFKIQPVEHVGELYDLSLQSTALLILLEKKIDNRRKIEEISIKHQEKEQAALDTARKRQVILKQTTRRSASGIAALRTAREEPTLMIIDDDPFSHRLMDSVLQKKFKLTMLENAEGALDAYAELAPNLLFLDINLPDVTGHELLEKIIELDPYSYIVMLSGSADRENILQAMSRGAKGFIAKPFSREKVFQYIERCPTINKEKII